MGPVHFALAANLQQCTGPKSSTLGSLASLQVCNASPVRRAMASGEVEIRVFVARLEYVVVV